MKSLRNGSFDQVEQVAISVKTTCPYCGVGCGLVAQRQADGEVEISGDTDHPANLGRICSKGAALTDTLSLEDRLLHPTVDGERTNWEIALRHVADKFGESIETYGPNSVAMYVSGQLLTEDYYVANKFMKGFVGSANIDTNSRLCMASAVAGHKRAFGADTVPGRYEDLELADLVVLAGSNLAWCHPVLHQRLLAAREERGIEIVVIDPRHTATCDEADLHLPIKPGTDVVLWNALLQYLVENGMVDESYVASYVNGFDQTVSALDSGTIDEIAETTGISATDIRCFFAMFGGTERVVTVFSQGVNQSIAGTDKVNAIINCHLATGRLGKPGMGAFSVTGQPNAMGGREVGGMANMLAAHMDIENEAHREIVREHWDAPRLVDKVGLKAVDMFRAVREGDIKVLWIMATNPAASMPEALRVREALETCPCVIVSDVVTHNDTLQYANVQLPSHAWGEKDGTVTNSERCISRQRAFLDPPTATRPDWWQITEVAKLLGHGRSFKYELPADIWREHIELTASGNEGQRDLDLSFLRDADYGSLMPQVWGSTTESGHRFFGNGRFFTLDNKANMVATPYRRPAIQPTEERPFVLLTGRIRDQWHTMTRTAKAPRLLTHIWGPTLAMHPNDVAANGLKEGHIVRVSTDHGTANLPLESTDQVRAGTVFANIHWNDQYSGEACIDALIGANLDPISGQPEFKAVPVTVERFDTPCFGYFLSTRKPKLDETVYWSAHGTETGWQVDFALSYFPDNLTEWLSSSFSSLEGDDVDAFEYVDRSRGDARCMRMDGNRVLEIAFVSTLPLNLSRDWLRKLVTVEIDDTFSVLAGVPVESNMDKGKIVCACEGVGEREIRNAIESNGCLTVNDLGKTLNAGENCGSCRPELSRLIADFSVDDFF